MINPECVLAEGELITACRDPSGSTVTSGEGGTGSPAGSVPKVMVCGNTGFGDDVECVRRISRTGFFARTEAA